MEDYEDYIKRLIQEVNSYQIEETVDINKTGIFGKKGEKTYGYKLFDKNGNKVSHFEFKEPKTIEEIKKHYVDIYVNPKYMEL